jgi:hypothetical protein
VKKPRYSPSHREQNFHSPGSKCSGRLATPIMEPPGTTVPSENMKPAGFITFRSIVTGRNWSSWKEMPPSCNYSLGPLSCMRCDSRRKLSTLCIRINAVFVHPSSCTTCSASSLRERIYSGLLVRSNNTWVKACEENITTMMRCTQIAAQTIVMVCREAIFVVRIRSTSAGAVLSDPSANSRSHEIRSF